MIGVVLWSAPNGMSAVFWCEDQGDLAYYEREGVPEVTGPLFAVGDMVSFDLTYEGRMRRAHAPQVIVTRVGEELPSKLRQVAGNEECVGPHRSGKVVDLNAMTSRRSSGLNGARVTG